MGRVEGARPSLGAYVKVGIRGARAGSSLLPGFKKGTTLQQLGIISRIIVRHMVTFYVGGDVAAYRVGRMRGFKIKENIKRKKNLTFQKYQNKLLIDSIRQ